MASNAFMPNLLPVPQTSVSVQVTVSYPLSRDSPRVTDHVGQSLADLNGEGARCESAARESILPWSMMSNLMQCSVLWKKSSLDTLRLLVHPLFS